MTATRFLPLIRILGRALVGVGACALLVALAAHPASAQEVSGIWQLEVNLGSGGGGRVTLDLEQDGSAVSGTYSGSYGNLVELTGTAEDGQLHVSFTNERIGEIAYEGTVVADSMWGSATYGDDLEGTFAAFRRPPAGMVSTVVGYGVLVLVLGIAIGGIVVSRRG